MTREPALRVLLVEDNQLDARAMAKALSDTRPRYELHHVESLAAALGAIDEVAFDCILLDLSLPDSDGLASVESVTIHAPHCPVVVLTGLDDPELAVTAVARGAQDYLVKSMISAELVTRAIQYAVARHYAETQLQAATSQLERIEVREQIARDLHDTVIQRLFATGMSLQAAAGSGNPDRIVARCIEAVDEIDDAIRELREAIFGLNTVTVDTPLAHELGQLVESQRDSLGFLVDLHIGDLSPLPPDLHRDVVAVVREALINVAKHADASSATVDITTSDRGLILLIQDDGIGMSGDGASGEPGNTAADHHGHGLRNMIHRAAEHGGTCRFRPGRASGTEVCWTVPLP